MGGRRKRKVRGSEKEKQEGDKSTCEWESVESTCLARQSVNLANWGVRGGPTKIKLFMVCNHTRAHTGRALLDRVTSTSTEVSYLRPRTCSLIDAVAATGPIC